MELHVCVCAIQYTDISEPVFIAIAIVGPLYKHSNIYVRAETERKGRG